MAATLSDLLQGRASGAIAPLYTGQRTAPDPAEGFDGAFYLSAYPDVKKNSAFAVDPLDHYLRYGVKEKRFPNEAAMKAAGVTLADLLPAATPEPTHSEPAPTAMPDPMADPNAIHRFDEDFYRNRYPELANDPAWAGNLFDHWRLVGARQGLFPNQDAANAGMTLGDALSGAALGRL